MSAVQSRGAPSLQVGGTVKRFAALFIFTIVATYSAIFYVPWAAVRALSCSRSTGYLIPAWYEIASQLVWQASLILMTPVWMVGLCLLYVDQRVRRATILSSMAAQRLGEIPAAGGHAFPSQPAIRRPADFNVPVPAPDCLLSITTLGLE